jgi:hypothetical protein
MEDILLRKVPVWLVYAIASKNANRFIRFALFTWLSKTKTRMDFVEDARSQKL